MNSSSVEQYVVTRGGTACVFGSAKNGIPWSVVCTDYICSTYCKSPRYTNIVVIAVDRSVNDIKTVMEDQDGYQKLKFIDAGSLPLDSICDELKIFSNDLDRSKMAVLVYSFSEIILSFGIRSAFMFYKNIQQLCRHTGNSSPGNITMAIHSTLHSHTQLHQIQNLTNVTVVVKPNNGTMSSHVVAEVHSIRKSPATGKVHEDLDLFSQQQRTSSGSDEASSFSMFKYLPRRRNDVEGDLAVAAVSGAADATQSGSDILAALLNPQSDTSTSAAGISMRSTAAAATTAAPALALHQRLITFDSNDPEFDEDSDPDDDLDL